MEKLRKVTTIALYAIIIPISIICMLLIMSKLSKYSNWAVMCLYVLFCLATLIIISNLWCKLYGKFQRIEPFLYWGMLCLMTILLFVVCRQWILESYYAFNDYTILLSSADTVANSEELESFYYEYFLDYGNNLSPMLLMSMLFRLADYLTISRLNFLQTIVCVQVSATAYCMGRLVCLSGNKTWRLPVLLLLYSFLPVWGFSASFYTDTMSMGLCIIAIALIKAGDDKKKGIRFLFLCIAGLFIVLAIIWKITAIIPVIAFGISEMLSVKKGLYKRLFPLLASVILFYLAFFIGFNTNGIYAESKTKADPIISWIALGMKNDGSWLENKEFVDRLHEYDTKEEKSEFSKQYIKENLSDAFCFNHIYNKMLKNFSNGNLNVDIFTLQNSNKLNWKMFDAGGNLYTPVMIWDITILFMVYLSIAANSVLNVIKKGKTNTMELCVHISLLGIFVFLMFWEASGRQLYNQMPMLLMTIILFMKKINAE